MVLRLHNTLTRTKQDFVPIDPKNVRMYVCGPTVYDFAHIGNARPLIVFDVLFRLLRHLYGDKHVTYVRNITDVDDKINSRAAQEYPDLPLNDAIRAVTEKTTAQFHADVDALGCLRPTHEPRATDYVEREAASTDMIRLIADLIANGHAYAAEGHVLFHVPSMPDYGTLSNRALDDMIAGARVEVAPYKKDPMDFVLWKPSKPGEPAWPSPWSNGRPGWHIECSAMAGALLGDTFDIHGGGIDLIFPHHENEIAQSRCAHGTATMANYWLHNGFLQVEGEKMSKSTGNFVTIRDALTRLRGWRNAGDIVRLNMLKTHYREPVDWTEHALIESATEIEAWRKRIRLTLPSTPPADFVEALADDVNTPLAISVLRRLAKETFSSRGSSRGREASAELVASLALLGFEATVSEAVAGAAEYKADIRAEIAKAIRSVEERERAADASARGIDAFVVQDLITDRLSARAAKDFAEADRIRDELDAMGIALKDAKDPNTGELVTTWEVKR
ncbi:MAG TPA: cysteine--tRNA ligase [Bauldia sp.]